jgi:hypothetical protein
MTAQAEQDVQQQQEQQDHVSLLTVVPYQHHKV